MTTLNFLVPVILRCQNPNSSPLFHPEYPLGFLIINVLSMLATKRHELLSLIHHPPYTSTFMMLFQISSDSASDTDIHIPMRSRKQLNSSTCYPSYSDLWWDDVLDTTKSHKRQKRNY